MFSLIDQVLRAGAIAGGPQDIQPVDPKEIAATLVARGLLVAGVGIATIGAGLSIAIQERRVAAFTTLDRNEEEVPHGD